MLILPVLAYAGTDNGKGNNGNQNGHDKGGAPVPVVPETNTGWALVPFFGAVLLFSARELLRPKAAQK